MASVNGALQIPTVLANFDDNCKRFRLGCWHLRTWVLCIGIFEAICLGVHISVAIRLRNVSIPLFGIQIALSVLFIIAIALMIKGIKKGRPGFLIPHVIMQNIAMIGCGILAVWFLMAFLPDDPQTTSDENRLDSYEKGIALTIAVFCFLAIALEIFFVYVVIRCYLYLAEKKRALGTPIPMQISIPYTSLEQGIQNPAYISGPAPPPAYKMNQPGMVSNGPEFSTGNSQSIPIENGGTIANQPAPMPLPPPYSEIHDHKSQNL